MPKLVQINLAALTRVEYSAVVEVPDDIDLDCVVEQFYDHTDGGEFWPDHEYWERGTCSHDEVTMRDPADPPDFRIDENYDITKVEDAEDSV